MTPAQYAEHRGVHISVVAYALKRGNISAARPGLIDPKKADLEWEKNTRQKLRKPRKAEMPEKARKTRKTSPVSIATNEMRPAIIPLTFEDFATARTRKETYTAELK